MSGGFRLILLLPFLAASFPAVVFSQQSKSPEKARPAAKSEAVAGPLEQLWKRAEAAIEKNDFPEAVSALKEFLSFRPKDAYGHFQLGYAYSGMKQPSEAEAEYRRAIELKADLAEAHLNLGLSLLDRDPSAAVAPLSRAAELKPNEAKGQFLTGLALELSGQLDAAIGRYRKAAELEAASFDVQFALGRALQAKGKPAEAEAALQIAVALRNDSAPARLGLAQTMLAQHEAGPAARELAAYLNLKPEDREARFRLASLDYDLGENEKALAELDRVEAGLEKPEMRFYRLRTDILVHQKKYEEAAAMAQKALSLAPGNAELHALQGRLRMQIKDLAGAERELLAALKLDGRLSDAMRDLASVYFLGEKYPAMLNVLDQLAKRETPASGTWFIRAIAYDKLGRKPEAVEAYKKFLEVDEVHNPDREFQARQRIRILTKEMERKK